MNVDSITTPFGRRSMTYGQLKHQTNTAKSSRSEAVDKWKVFRHISEVRNQLGLQDRALAVLNALLSFYPGVELNPKQALIVFPSNEQLALRAHGVCTRTLRRNLAALVDAGIICRNDSPNGKRYAHRARNGEIESAYGFDLRPLITRAAEFAQLAEQLAEDTLRTKRTKEAITICRRDLRKLIQLNLEQSAAVGIPDFSRQLDETLAAIPRKPSQFQLQETLSQLQFLKTELLNNLKLIDNSSISPANEGQDVRHIEESESESHLETQMKSASPNSEVESLGIEVTTARRSSHRSDLPIDIVLRACPDIETYSIEGRITSWRSLIDAANLGRQQLRIDKIQYHQCRTMIGDKAAAIIVACIFQRRDHIRSAGAYFCQLAKLAQANKFAPEKLLMSHLKQTYLSRTAQNDATAAIAVSDRLQRLSLQYREPTDGHLDKPVVRISDRI